MTDALEKLINSMNRMGGTLPKICIHTPIQDNFSHMYEPNKKCKCGCTEFINGEMEILKDSFGHKYPKKKVHKCKKCNEVRLSTLKESSQALVHIKIKKKANAATQISFISKTFLILPFLIIYAKSA